MTHPDPPGSPSQPVAPGAAPSAGNTTDFLGQVRFAAQHFRRDPKIFRETLDDCMGGDLDSSELEELAKLQGSAGELGSVAAFVEFGWRLYELSLEQSEAKAGAGDRELLRHTETRLRTLLETHGIIPVLAEYYDLPDERIPLEPEIYKVGTTSVILQDLARPTVALKLVFPRFAQMPDIVDLTKTYKTFIDYFYGDARLTNHVPRIFAADEDRGGSPRRCHVLNAGRRWKRSRSTTASRCPRSVWASSKRPR